MTAAAPKTYAYAEFENYTDPDRGNYAGVRVTLADKIAAERSCRANGWNPQYDAARIYAFLSWHAGKRTGEHSLDYETFMGAVIDAGVLEDDGAEDETGDELDPTRPAPGTGSP